jgi:hypothetical protein
MGAGRVAESPFRAQPGEPRFRVSIRAREGGPVMSVYVGIDVHRKRSQVAVMMKAGRCLTNRNVPKRCGDGVERESGNCQLVRRWRLEAAFGWGWLVNCSRATTSYPHLVHPLRCKANRLGPVEELTRLMRRPWRTPDYGRICCRRAWIAPPAVRQLRAMLRHAGAVGPIAHASCVTGSMRYSPTTDTTGPPAVGADPAGTGWPACNLPAVVQSGGGGLPRPHRRPADPDRPISTIEVHAGAKADPRVKLLTRLPGVGRESHRAGHSGRGR